jgi:hypothetical protein
LIRFRRYGIFKVAAVVGMVVLVHAIEAYVLNPAIYSGLFKNMFMGS